MVDLQVGNLIGVTAVQPVDAKIAEITADGVNTFTVAVADVSKFYLGQKIDIRVKATGADFAVGRTVTGITAAGVITYDGADVATVAGTHAVYYDGPSATVNQDQATNINGGASARNGFRSTAFTTVQSMRERLQVIDAAYFTDARLNTMTWNDLVYALRQKDFASSIK